MTDEKGTTMMEYTSGGPEECTRNHCQLPYHHWTCNTYPRIGRAGGVQRGQNYCVDPPLGCGQHIPPEEFDTWDATTRNEAGISGLCKNCQDKFFGPCEEGCEHGF